MTGKSNETIQLRQFPLETMVGDAVVVLVGKRRSGKSWLMRQVLHMLSERQVPYGKIYSGTEHCNPFFRKFFPALYIDNKFTDDDLAELIESQRRKVRKNAKKHNIDDGRCLENTCVLVLDDMLSEESIWRKSLRDNIDYVFIFANEGQNLRKLWENYAGAIPDFGLFKKIFYQCTRDRGCLVIDKTSTSDKLTDKVFHFRAKDPGKFRFGSPAFWKLHDERYESEDDDSGAEEKRKVKHAVDTYGAKGKEYTVRIV